LSYRHQSLHSSEFRTSSTNNIFFLSYIPAGINYTSLLRTLKLKTLGKVVDRRKALRTTVAVTTVLAFIKLHIFATASLTLLTAIYLPIGIVLWTDYFLTYKG